MIVSAGENRHADDIGVLLECGLDDSLWRLPKAGVDDLHPDISERARDYLRATVVPVQARFGNDHSNLAHGFKRDLLDAGRPSSGLPS